MLFPEYSNAMFPNLPNDPASTSSSSAFIFLYFNILESSTALELSISDFVFYNFISHLLYPFYKTSPTNRLSHQLHIQKRIWITLLIMIGSFICFKTQMFIKSNCLRILLVDGNFPDSIILNTIFLPKYSKEAPPRASSLLLHIFSYYFLSVPFSFPEHQQIQSYKYQSHSHGSKCLRLQRFIHP